MKHNEFNIFRIVQTRSYTHINWYSEKYQMLFHKMGIDNYSQIYKIDECLGMEMLNECLICHLFYNIECKSCTFIENPITYTEICHRL